MLGAGGSFADRFTLQYTVKDVPNSVADDPFSMGYPQGRNNHLFVLVTDPPSLGFWSWKHVVDILDAFCQINKRWFESVSYDDWAV